MQEILKNLKLLKYSTWMLRLLAVLEAVLTVVIIVFSAQKAVSMFQNKV